MYTYIISMCIYIYTHISVSAWQCVARHDSIWQRMTVYQGVWQCMTVYDSVWQPMYVCSYVRNYMCMCVVLHVYTHMHIHSYVDIDIDYLNIHMWAKVNWSLDLSKTHQIDGSKSKRIHWTLDHNFIRLVYGGFTKVGLELI